MPKIILIRHGQTEYNVQHRYQGHSDIALNEFGLAQAARLQHRFVNTPIIAVYSSDLVRAYHTANVIVAGQLEVQIEPLLREVSVGDFEGLTWPEMLARFPDEVALWTSDRRNNAPPNGESLQQAANRIQSWLDQVVKTYPAQTDTILVVTHGAIISIFLCLIMNMDLNRYWQWRIDNCSVSIVDLYHKGGILSLFNNTSHLEEQ